MTHLLVLLRHMGPLMGTWTDVSAQRMFLIGSCTVSWFLDELRLWGAGLFLTIEGTGENHPGWQED